MKLQYYKVIVLSAAAGCVSACSTVKMPTIDVPGIPEFKEAAAKLVDGYPDASEAPERPEDLRSAREWDAAARELIAHKNGFDLPPLGDMPATDADIEAEVTALRDLVRSYKLDDPQ